MSTGVPENGFGGESVALKISLQARESRIRTIGSNAGVHNSPL